MSRIKKARDVVKINKKDYWTQVKKEAINFKSLIKKQKLERIDFIKNSGSTLLKAYKNRWSGGIEELIDDVSENSVSSIIKDYKQVE